MEAEALTNMPHLANFDYVAILIYIALMGVIGLTFGWLVKDVGSYFKGGGTIPWVMATITNYMGMFSTFVFVAYAGIAYNHGMVSITVFMVTVPGCVIAGLYFGGRWRRTGHTTPVQYLEQRYGYSMRQLIMWLGLIMRFLDNMVRLYAIGIFIEAVTPIGFGWAIVISGIIVTAFNIIGGVWTVAIMSTVQFIILILVTAILLPLSLEACGGLGALAAKYPEHMDFFNGPKGNLIWLAVYCMMVVLKYNENWTFIQKFYCVRDEAAAKKVGIYSGVLFFVFAPVFLIPAVVSPLIVPELTGTDMEKSYVLLSLTLLPAGVMGIMFSSMFAATMSSLNAEYNIMAGVLTTDVYQRMINPKADDKRLLLVARISTGLVGAIMIAGAFGVGAFGGAFEANKLFTGVLAIPIGIPLVFGIISCAAKKEHSFQALMNQIFRQPNSNSAIASIVVGVILGIVLNMIPAKTLSWEAATIIETVACLLIYYYPSFMKKRVYSEEENKFFKLVETPIRDEDKPTISPQYVKALVYLFVFSMVVSGVLFAAMSLPAVFVDAGKTKELNEVLFHAGLYGALAGGICILCAVVLYVGYKIKAPKATQETAL